MRVQNLNTEILKHAADQAGEPLRRKFPKLPDWIEGVKQPTLNQLAQFSKAVHMPFGYFFLKELPEQKYPIPHYRTVKNDPFVPSDELRETLLTLQQRQTWARELCIDLGQEKLPFGNTISTVTPVEKAVALIREILDLNGSWAHTLPRWSDALRTLVDRTEQAGIFVVINGVVGNNTSRSLSVQEFRGLVLYDDYAPFIFINGKDAISGKIFTLVHEVAHVLLGESASFDLDHLQAASHSNVEEFCDRVAAEFLVPARELEKSWDQGRPSFEDLARHFKVSQIVIARRMLDLKMLDREAYFAFYEDCIHREVPANDKPGGNFFNTAPYRISHRFFNLVHQAVQQNNMLYTQAFRLTGLSPKSYDGYIKQHL